MRLSNSLQARYFNIMRAALTRYISPELTSQKAKNVAHLLDDLLLQFALESNHGEQLDAEYIEAIKAIVSPHAGEGVPAEDDRQAVQSLAPQLYAKRDLKALITVLQTELSYQQFIAAEHTNNHSTKQCQTQPSVVDERPAISAYLRQRYPHLTSIKVLNIKPLAGGRSKQTTILQLANYGDELAAEVVMRRDLPTSIVAGSVVDEYPVINAVYKAGGVPIPQPYLLETDPNLLGGCFILLEKAVGNSIGDFYAEVSTATGDLAAIGKQEAKALARLHSFDITLFNETAVDTEPNIREQLVAQIDTLEARASSALESHQSVSLNVACAWLRDHIDYGVIGPTALLHGDMGLHNQLIENDSITALVDWELCHVGPVAKELGACRISLKQLLPWSEFIQYYQQYGGNAEACDPKAIAFYYLMTAATGVSYSKLARHYFSTGASDDITLGHAGYLCGHFGERALTEALLEALQLSENP